MDDNAKWIIKEYQRGTALKIMATMYRIGVPHVKQILKANDIALRSGTKTLFRRNYKDVIEFLDRRQER